MDYIEWNAKNKACTCKFPIKRARMIQLQKNITFNAGFKMGIILVFHILALWSNHSLFSSFVEKNNFK